MFENDEKQLSWPPLYQVRKSLRAKHLGLRVSARSGLEVILPTTAKHHQIPIFLAKHRLWIEKKLGEHRVVPETTLPETVQLVALDQLWQIIYQATTSAKLSWRCEQQQIILTGNTNDPVLCRLALRCWLRQQAEQQLLPWLAAVSKEIGLRYEAATIRLQTTRWGSCSARKRISLNASLLLLPAPLVRYILVHELCHTVHLNHSAKFWDLVAQFEPYFKKAKQDLRQLQRQLPAWIQLD